jgi:hypothetical protein
VGEAEGNDFGRFGGWVALTEGEGAGRGVGRRICAWAESHAKTMSARTGMRRRVREITLI